MHVPCTLSPSLRTHKQTQDFEKPFDSPAIIVVGHQTDGKSALVEALVGFQLK